MRLPTIIVVALVAVLTTASLSTAGTARDSRALENGIELVDGSGRVVATVRGAMIATLGQGKVTITDLPDRVGTDILVQGQDVTREVDGDTTVYLGSDMRFRIFRGRWKVQIEGVRIDASIVGTGTLGLEGSGGRFSFAGAPERAWPEDWLSIKLGD